MDWFVFCARTYVRSRLTLDVGVDDTENDDAHHADEEHDAEQNPAVAVLPIDDVAKKYWTRVLIVAILFVFVLVFAL